MSSTFKLAIRSANTNAINGYHTIVAVIEEYQDGLDGQTVVMGVPEKFGISQEELQSRFGGDAAKWRDTVAKTLRDRHLVRREASGEVMKWTNQKFEMPQD
jgi:hypothetical protein